MQARTLIFMAILVNLLFSYLMLLYNQPINPDGIIYIHCAQTYLQNGLHDALRIYPWPFYSILLAKTSVLLHISLLNTGYLLNSIFSSILVLFFILTVKLWDNSAKTLLWAAAVIVLLPEINHGRYTLVRDIGYYAFFMASLWSYIKFLQTEKFLYASLFTVTIIVATLFRVEGAVFLALIPLITIILKCDFKLILINIALGLIGFFIFRHATNFGRIPEIISDANPTQLFSLFQQKAGDLKQYLGVLAQGEASVFLVSGLIGILVVSFVTTLGIFSCLLLVYGIYQKSLPQNKTILQALLSYILINIILLSVFLAHQLFLDWRYTFPLALVFLLFIPSILAQCNKWIAIAYLLFNMAASFVPFGPSKSYMVEAGNWVANNTPVTAKIYSNDNAVIFYANREQDNKISKGDYVVMISKIHAPTPIPSNIKILMTFRNHRGDAAYIYKN